MINYALMAEWCRTQFRVGEDASSNPAWLLLIFFFIQNLKACSPFAQIFANSGAFLY